MIGEANVTVPRRVRWFVAGLLGMILVPGVIGFDLWPLTGWRLFSLSRDDTQHEWVLQAVADDGRVTNLDLEDLPLAYRHAAWILDDLDGAAPGRQAEVCEALLVGVRASLPAPHARGLRVTRDDQRLVVSGGEIQATEHEPTVVTTCGDAER